MEKLDAKIRVGIVDDHLLLREGLAAVLSRSERYSIVFEGESAQDAIMSVAAVQPDLVILDLGMDGGGLEALRKIKSDYPDIFCVILTSSDDPLKAMAALSLGAEGYILKGIKAGELLQALDAILARKTYVSPDFAMKLVSAANQQSQSTAQHTCLSHREEQVLEEVQNGLTNRQVAVRLKLSEQTVKVYMSSAMQKLGVHNRVSAVQVYQKQAGQRGSVQARP